MNRKLLQTFQRNNTANWLMDRGEKENEEFSVSSQGKLEMLPLKH